MSILRSLAIHLGLETDAASFAEGAATVEVVKLGLEKLKEAAESVAEAFIEGVKATAEYSTQIVEMGAATGAGTKSLQQLYAAGIENGISLEGLSHSLIILTRQMSNAKDGGEETAKTFRQLGVQFKDGAGKLRPVEDVLVDISDKFSKMKDGGEKTAASLHLFGKSGAGLIDFLNKGRDAFEEFFQAETLSDEQLDAGKQVVETQRALAFQTQQLTRAAVGPLLPVIRDLLKEFFAWKKANADILKQNIAAAVGTGIKIVKALGEAFKFTVATIKLLKANWQFFAGALIAAVPVILALTAQWVAANGFLAASYVIVGIEAVKAAAKATYAWLAAAAPFVALAAIVTGLFLLFDDFRTYQESINRGGTGKNTLVGRFLAAFKELETEMLKEPSKQPWWYTTLLAAKQTVEDIIQLMHNWQEFSAKEFFFGASAPKSALTPEAQARAQNLKSPLPDESQRDYENRLYRIYLQEQSTPQAAPSFSPGYSVSPSLPASYSGGQSSGASVVVNQTINAAPGMSEERVAEIAGDLFSSALQSQNEELSSSASYSSP